MNRKKLLILGVVGALLNSGMTKAGELTRPQTVAECISFREIGDRVEIYLAPDRLNSGWSTHLEFRGLNGRIIREARVETRFDGLGTLYTGKRLTLRITETDPQKRLIGLLHDAKQELQENYHCRMLR